MIDNFTVDLSNATIDSLSGISHSCFKNGGYEVSCMAKELCTQIDGYILMMGYWIVVGYIISLLCLNIFYWIVHHMHKHADNELQYLRYERILAWESYAKQFLDGRFITVALFYIMIVLYLSGRV